MSGLNRSAWNSKTETWFGSTAGTSAHSFPSIAAVKEIGLLRIAMNGTVGKSAKKMTRIRTTGEMTRTRMAGEMTRIRTTGKMMTRMDGEMMVMTGEMLAHLLSASLLAAKMMMDLMSVLMSGVM